MAFSWVLKNNGRQLAFTRHYHRINQVDIIEALHIDGYSRSNDSLKKEHIPHRDGSNIASHLDSLHHGELVPRRKVSTELTLFERTHIRI